MERKNLGDLLNDLNRKAADKAKKERECEEIVIEFERLGEKSPRAADASSNAVASLLTEMHQEIQVEEGNIEWLKDNLGKEARSYGLWVETHDEVGEEYCLCAYTE